MYTNAATNNKFTGYVSGGDYIYPSAPQNAVIKFNDFYLSAIDNDFAEGGMTFSYMACDSEDITIGNAPAAVLNVTMLNPSGLMESLSWGDGTAYIGCVTTSATADTYSSLPCHVYVNSIHYGINSSGNARRGSTTYTLGGTPKAVISNSNGTDVLFITDTAIGRYNGGWSVVTTPTDAQAFLAAKCRGYIDPLGIVLDANGLPATFNDVTNNTKQTYTYIPMGVFDFANVEAAGIAFGVEAYDKMTLFDADATDWVNSIDFTSPKTISTIIGDLMTEMGFTGHYTVDASAVNTSVQWSVNPITSYSVTYRQVLKWLAEAIGCNARMTRTGDIEFVAYHSTPVGNTITCDTIVGNTRTKGKSTIPQITKVICYNTVGAGYEDGTSGSDYYVVANPFIDPSSGLAPVTALLGLVDDIPAYYATTLGVMYSDPRIDAGDFITVKDTDNSNTYVVPVMSQTIHWNGVCETEYSATGNQVRQVPDSLEGTGLSEVVSSNPAAVVNMIMAKGITVYDSSNNVLFSAIGDDHLVEIAGFNVDSNQIIYDNAYGTIKMNSSTGFSTKNKTTQKSAFLDDGIVSVADESVATNPKGSLSPDGLVLSALSYYYHAKYEKDGIDIWEQNVGKATLDLTNGLHIDDNTNDVDVTPTSISITNGSVTSTQTATGVTTTYNSYTTQQTQSEMTVTDGSNKTKQDATSFTAQVGSNKSTQDATSFSIVNSPGSATIDTSGASFTDGVKSASFDTTGMTLNDGTASSKLSVIKRTMDSANTTYVDLQRGMYLAIVTHTNNTSAGQQGLYVIQAYDTNSVILTIAAAANSTLTISGLTLTWTTTNTYRALRLIYLS